MNLGDLLKTILFCKQNRLLLMHELLLLIKKVSLGISAPALTFLYLTKVSIKCSKK